MSRRIPTRSRPRSRDEASIAPLRNRGARRGVKDVRGCATGSTKAVEIIRGDNHRHLHLNHVAPAVSGALMLRDREDERGGEAEQRDEQEPLHTRTSLSLSWRRSTPFHASIASWKAASRREPMATFWSARPKPMASKSARRSLRWPGLSGRLLA